MKIIALGHKKRQFKDRFAQVLREHLRALRRTGKSGVNTYALITPVKSAATRMFGIYNIDAIDKDMVMPEVGMTPRRVWIMLANDMRKHVSSRFLVDIFIRMTETQADCLESDIWIIFDLRFQEEVNRLREFDTKFVKVVREDFHAPSDECDSNLEQWHGWDDEVRFSRDASNAELEQIAAQWITANKEWLQEC